MSSPLLIKGGRIVDPASSLDSLRDLRVRDGVVAEIGENLEAAPDEELFDARGSVVAPGFVDIHVHLRTPGFPEKETIATGTEAAVRGGFTTIACMPNTKPALDDPAVLAELARRNRARGAMPRLSYRSGDARPAWRRALRLRCARGAGAVAFSDDGDTVEDGDVMRAAALRARNLPEPVIAHCVPEDEIVARDLAIAAETGKRWHVAHLSTAHALELLRRARALESAGDCEVTPHHLTFTSALLESQGAAAKVHPPLRSESDVRALRAGVRDGTIDAFASDHAPHTAAEKTGDIRHAAPGFSGLEVAVGAYAAALPDLPLHRFVELISTNPARIVNLPAGSLRIGAAADITIFAEREWRVDPAAFASKGRCTPFAGALLPRKVIATIVGGVVRYSAAELAT